MKVVVALGFLFASIFKAQNLDSQESAKNSMAERFNKGSKLFLKQFMSNSNQSEPTPDPQSYDQLSESELRDINYYGLYSGIPRCPDDKILQFNCYHCKKLDSDNKIYVILRNLKFDTKGVIFVNDRRKEIILSYRATESENNWSQDFAIVFSPFKYAQQPAKLKVHTGFLNAMESFSPQMEFALKELLSQPSRNDYKVIFSGHSLGGAIAILSAIKLQFLFNLDPNKIQVFTYGQPRLGNLEFANHINSLNIPIYRAVNYNDPIPHTPPRIFGYHHHNTEYFQDRMYGGGYNIKRCRTGNGIMEDPNCSLNVKPDFDGKLHSKFSSLDFAIPC